MLTYTSSEVVSQTMSTHKCSVCNISKQEDHFSKSQLRRRKNERKCSECINTKKSTISSTSNQPLTDTSIQGPKVSAKGTTTKILGGTLALIVLIVAIGLGHIGNSDEQGKEVPDVIEIGIKFLIEKGVYAEDVEERNQQFNHIRNPDVLNEKLRAKYKKIQERLIQLVNQTEETHLEKVPEEFHKFSEKEFPGYKQENVFFLQYPQSLVQRHQLSGLCYMHAPAVVQYYAISKTLNGTNHKQMIDLLKVVKDHFTAKELEHHIFDDKGGDSREFLEKILEPNSTTISIGWTEFIPYGFDKYGVGLVSQFKVHQDFQSSIHHHYGLPSGSISGNHAMALVGYRQDGDKLFFLLQNWWKTKQFVEVDEVYLEQSGASVYFIKTPQTSIPKDFSTHSGQFAEMVGIDKPEGFIGEMRNPLNYPIPFPILSLEKFLNSKDDTKLLPEHPNHSKTTSG